MTDRFRRFIPIGFRVKPAICLYFFGFILSVIISICNFMRNLMMAIYNISAYENGIRTFFEGHYMKEFLRVRGDSFYILKLYAGILIAYSIFCIISHFIGSKNIYTMLRLKNPFELFIRCALITVIMILISIITIITLNALYIEIYLYVVPEENLWPWWDEKIWRNLL